MWNLSNSEIIAVSSMVIALLALGTAFWQAYISRRHNRLSVRPFMEHYQERIPDAHMSVSIVNHGTGPAILEKVYFTISPNTQRLDIDEFLDKILLTMRSPKGDYENATFIGTTIFPPGKITNVVKFELKPGDDENFRIINTILDDTSIHIVYRSIYDEVYRCSEALHLP